MTDISAALNNKRDNSEQFHAFTQEIASDIATQFKCYYEIERWMNYTYSNKITLRFNNNRPCKTKRETYDRQLYVMLSAMGPFFTFINYVLTEEKYLCFSKDNKSFYRTRGVWIFAENDSLPKEIHDCTRTITEMLEKKNLRLLDDEQLLEQIAEGHYTDLDGIPATVFQVLFGELV